MLLLVAGVMASSSGDVCLSKCPKVMRSFARFC